MNANNQKKYLRPAKLITMLAVMAMVLAACAPKTSATTTPQTTQTVLNTPAIKQSNPTATQSYQATVSTPAATKAATLAATTAATPAATTAATPAATTAATPTSITTEPTIDVTKDPTLGNILTANNGMTLYAYAWDTADTSNCSAACQLVWKPLVTLGKPSLGTSVDASMVGTAKLADGTMVVTYNHMPLYTFVNDAAAQATSGQRFDNAWSAVTTDGKLAGSPQEVSLKVTTHPILGDYVTDGKGIAVYTFTKDITDTSNCDAKCEAIWNPVTTLGTPNVGSGLDDTLIGNISIANGMKQVTYNHLPLYYYSGDGKPSDLNGQGFKSLWYVIGPDGSSITTMLPTPITSEPTVNVTNEATYGQILTDGTGLALYINTSDEKDKSSCSASCLQNWTPVYTLGQPVIGTGVDAKLVGTIDSGYGMKIVTYNHHPLYVHKLDKPGNITGEGANAAYYVIGVNGTPILKR